MKGLRLLCGVSFLPFLSFRGNSRSSVANAAPTLENSLSTSDRKCWIFMHLQKSGGSTVKGVLKQRFSHKYRIFDNPEWKQGSRYLQAFGKDLAGGDKWNVIAGGYAEALRHSSAADDKCQWFTQFRHPVTRMVSAYYYCHKPTKDPVCASMVLNADNVDLVTFAKHWGNFAVRQFALSLVPVDDVLEYSRNETAKEDMLSVHKVPGWYLFKMYLDNKVKTPEYVEIPDAALYQMLQPVQNLLRDRYAVGILEEFNTTLSLFDAALNMPGVDWHNDFLREGRLQVHETHLKEKAASLANAWTSSEIKKYMQLGLVLYEHAVDVFHQQARSYGLT